MVAYYLKHAERDNRAGTYKMRANALFNFVYGLSSKWRTKSESKRAKLTKADKIHPGCRVNRRCANAQSCHTLWSWRQEGFANVNIGYDSCTN